MSRPTVLFVCVHNAGRSQMAAGFLSHLAGDAIEVRSAGSAPADTINPAAVEAMAGPRRYTSLVPTQLIKALDLVRFPRGDHHTDRQRVGKRQLLADKGLQPARKALGAIDRSGFEVALETERVRERPGRQR